MPASSHRYALAVLVFALAANVSLATAVDISRADAKRIGRRIWQNECGGTIAGLTSWNAGENFASLGIGHFIWYPKDQRGPFEESFPLFVRFAAGHGTRLPDFVAGERAACPWNSRAEFNRDQSSPRMKELREFLVSTIDLQTQFLILRLQNALPKILGQASDPKNVQYQFERVAATPEGCYALVDYVNFKGEGTLVTERYRGEGWGLMQVLENMRGTDPQSALDEFAASAKTVLRHRVANSPPERGEARWLPGWIARVDGYRRK